jgi:hypothetical protein
MILARADVRQRADLTFKHNLGRARHGWIRLTPAYSVKLVTGLLEGLSGRQYLVDPFSGTGTTGVVASELGLCCDMYEINRFLVWLAGVKTANYSRGDLEETVRAANEIHESVARGDWQESWSPRIHDIERWWNPYRLRLLSAIFHGLTQQAGPDGRSRILDLLEVSFCQVLMRWSNAAFNHQSLSFKQESGQQAFDPKDDMILEDFVRTTERICADAQTDLEGQAAVYHEDARALRPGLGKGYTTLITSPPYPNRISYIRELRPYMYWLGYLMNGREAGEMDWQSIGGTWGVATSRLLDWRPRGYLKRDADLLSLVESIRRESPILANYVHKYFEDMTEHFRVVGKTLARGAVVNYIIGNSKFYDVVVPTEEIFQTMLKRNDFSSVAIDLIRKRNSKKELYEYVVSGLYASE